MNSRFIHPDFQRTRHACRLEGYLGPLDAIALFPDAPGEPVTVFTPDTAPCQVQINVPFKLAMSRIEEARRFGRMPEFYYS